MPFNSWLIPQIGKLGLIFDTRPCEIDDLAVLSRHLSSSMNEKTYLHGFLEGVLESIQVSSL